MMDKLIEYIPLLIFGLIIVVSYYKKYKKKRDEEYANTTLPQSVRTDQSHTRKETVRNTPSNKPTNRNTVAKNAPRQGSPSQPEGWSFDQEIISSLEKKNEQNTYVNQFFDDSLGDKDPATKEESIVSYRDNEPSGFPIIIDPKDFNELKKAVIYSEILQRKQY